MITADQKEFDALMEVATRRCKDEHEVETVCKAFEFANQAHKNVRRRSGEPYMLHPIAVAHIVVTEIGLGCKSICAALLHDVVEDTAYTVEDIRNLFGDKIASLVDGLTKIKTVLDNEDFKGTSTESLQAENFKRILLTLNDDVRVVLIKLADRLHNCRTIEFMPEHKRDKILSETMFIFIPLAHRLGLYSVKSEMENIWLRYKEPEDYRRISERIKGNIAQRDKDIDDFIEPISQALTQAGYRFTIKKRIKTPYSIWYKMRTKQVPFEQIYDLYAVRIIFDPQDNNVQTERGQAYLIFSTITHLYRENLGRRRDWISQPKSNGYEALHCTLMSHAGFWVEVQIRSKRMDDIAEKGIAAHWAYKNDGYISENDSEMDKWLAEVQDILLSDDVSALELLDIIHKDLVSSEIVVFTPKGEQKAHPRRSHGPRLRLPHPHRDRQPRHRRQGQHAARPALPYPQGRRPGGDHHRGERPAQDGMGVLPADALRAQPRDRVLPPRLRHHRPRRRAHLRGAHPPHGAPELPRAGTQIP